ncbi:MAG: TetR/AcrR family transcriptional regulator [Bacteroidales bacterium]|jgi:AcrR family transcriptional regulator|nr:TetR/AcrR family transcriptional regulator [Bacteroidales bacterium]
MPRSEEKYREIRESARKKIMDAALELFAGNGFHSTSISDIAGRAGISKGLMYNYFESKEELLREIIFTGFDSITYGFDPDRDGVLTSDELVFFIRESFRLVEARPSFWKLFFLIMYQSPAIEMFRKELKAKTDGYMKMLVACFAGRKADDPEAEALLFSSLLDGVCMNFLSDPERFPLRVVEKKIIEMYSNNNLK